MLCQTSGFGPGRDPRDVAEWTFDQFLCVTLGRKELEQHGPKIVRMTAKEAMQGGFLKLDPKGSLNQQIKAGTYKVPEHMKGTAYQIAPKPPPRRGGK